MVMTVCVRGYGSMLDITVGKAGVYVCERESVFIGASVYECVTVCVCVCVCVCPAYLDV